MLNNVIRNNAPRNRRTSRIVFCSCVSVACILLIILADVQLRYIQKLHNASELSRLPHAPFAIILGASVRRDGTPSSALRDRLERGIELYKKGIVDRLLLTGDDGAYHVDEMSVMTRYVKDRGVPDDRVLVDGHGYRTYESCKRARGAYGVTRAIIATQRFHLGRALYVCNQLGIEVVGVLADQAKYDKIIFFWLREIPASFKAWWDVNVKTPQSPVSSKQS